MEEAAAEPETFSEEDKADEVAELENNQFDNTEELKSEAKTEENLLESGILEESMTVDTTYITKGTKIKGDIETDGSVDILGTIVGNVSCDGKLIVGGVIEGNVSAGEIYASQARITGEVATDGSIKIGMGTVVEGNVTAKSAVIAGAVKGDIDVDGPVIIDSTAVVVGNVKTRSVQVNTGAVIQGYCSQGYAEIDLEGIFGKSKDASAEGSAKEEADKAEEAENGAEDKENGSGDRQRSNNNNKYNGNKNSRRK